MVTRLAENTSQLKPMFAPSASSMSPFLHDRIVLRPMNAPAPIRMPRLVSPFASIRQLSSTTTLLPMWILCGWRNTTFWPKTTLRPHEPSSSGYSVLRSTSPSAPARACAIVTTSSYFSSAPRPERPTTSAAYFARFEVPGANSWSCAFAISGDPAASAPLALRRASPELAGSSCEPRRERVARRSVALSSEPAMFTVPVQRAADAFAQADARREPDFHPRARDVERAALREKIDAPTIERRLEAQRRANGLAHRAGRPERPDRQVPRRRRDAGRLGHQRHERVQRRHFPAGQDVGAIGRRRMHAAQTKALDQIVDERQMVID